MGNDEQRALEKTLLYDFIDLEKTYDQIPKVLWKTWEKKAIHAAYIQTMVVINRCIHAQATPR